RPRKMGCFVRPPPTTVGRDDIGYSARAPYLIAMKKACEPVGEARDDHGIFEALARRVGVGEIYSAGRDVGGWLPLLYERAREKSIQAGVNLPTFRDFWEAGMAEAAGTHDATGMLAAFRADPEAYPLKTPSGRIEIYSERIASFGYEDCPPHATWLEPVAGPAATTS